MKVVFLSGTYIQAPEGKAEVRLGPGDEEFRRTAHAIHQASFAAHCGFAPQEFEPWHEAFEAYQSALERVPDQPVALRRVEVLRFRAVQSDVLEPDQRLATARHSRTRRMPSTMFWALLA